MLQLYPESFFRCFEKSKTGKSVAKVRKDTRSTEKPFPNFGQKIQRTIWVVHGDLGTFSTEDYLVKVMQSLLLLVALSEKTAEKMPRATKN